MDALPTRVGGAVILLAMLAVFVPGADAANTGVDIRGFQFVPAQITITAGDSVTWRNFDDAQHSAFGANGAISTGSLSKGDSKTLTFNVPGTFNYVCGIHGASMSGSLMVAAAPTPAPTPRPTPAPTAAPTPLPTTAPTPSPSPTPVVTAAASATESVAVAASAAPSAAASGTGGGSSPLLLTLLAAVALLAVAGFAFARIRRG